MASRGTLSAFPSSPFPFTHLVGVALAAILVAGPARAGDVELWVGESSTQSITRTQIVAGTVRIENSDPSVARVTRPRGDNARITITGVKEGRASIKATGRMVVYHMGTGPQNLRTEEEFTAYIDVVVKKPEEIAKLAVVHEKQRMSIRFPKKPERITVLEVLTNSNPKVCTAKGNAPWNMTVIGKREGTSVVTLKLKVQPKKGPARTVKGVLHVEVRKLVGKRKKNVRIGWNGLFTGRVVIVDEEAPRRPAPKSFSYPSTSSNSHARPVPGAGPHRDPASSSYQVLHQVMPDPRPRHHHEPSDGHPQTAVEREAPAEAVHPAGTEEAESVQEGRPAAFGSRVASPVSAPGRPVLVPGGY